MFGRMNKGIFIVVAVAVISISLPFTSIKAKDLRRPGTISALDNSVGGEPGEDPHLNIKPVFKIDWMNGASNEDVIVSRNDMDLVYSKNTKESYNFDSTLNVVWKFIINSLINTLNR